MLYQLSYVGATAGTALPRTWSSVGSDGFEPPKLAHLVYSQAQLSTLATALAHQTTRVRSDRRGRLTSPPGSIVSERPTFKTADTLWPPSYSLWLSIPSHQQAESESSTPIPYAAAAFPKLTVLLDADPTGASRPRAEWTQTVRQPGRGPILRLQFHDVAAIRDEVFAAAQSVWPDLGPSRGNRLE